VAFTEGKGSHAITCDTETMALLAPSSHLPIWSPWHHSGITQASLRHHSGITQASLRHHSGITQALNLLSHEYWIKRTKSVKARGFIFGARTISVPATVFLLLSLLVYAVATYIGQVGYACAWYAILAARDICASPLNLFHSDQSGASMPLPPPVQTEVLYIDLVMDALIAILAVGVTY